MLKRFQELREARRNFLIKARELPEAEAYQASTETIGWMLLAAGGFMVAAFFGISYLIEFLMVPSYSLASFLVPYVPFFIAVTPFALLIYYFVLRDLNV